MTHRKKLDYPSTRSVLLYINAQPICWVWSSSASPPPAEEALNTPGHTYTHFTFSTPLKACCVPLWETLRRLIQDPLQRMVAKHCSVGQRLETIAANWPQELPAERRCKQNSSQPDPNVTCLHSHIHTRMSYQSYRIVKLAPLIRSTGTTSYAYNHYINIRK